MTLVVVGVTVVRAGGSRARTRDEEGWADARADGRRRGTETTGEMG